MGVGAGSARWQNCWSRESSDDQPAPRYHEPTFAMLYVEKMQPSSAANGTSSAQSERSTSVASRGWCSGASVAKALSVVKAEGHGLLACPPGKLDKDKLKAFSDMLSNEGIDLS